MMKKYSMFSAAVLSLSLLIVSCSNQGETKQQQVQEESLPEVKPGTESQLLFDYLAESGDYVNSRQFPSLIKAKTLYESLDDTGTLVIDIRDSDTFAKGHINGAKNVSFSDLPYYFENDIQAFRYDKIAIACYHGQMASYATALLRLMGYGNVYSLRWGMSGWNKDINELHPWGGELSDELTGILENDDNEKPVPQAFPELKTGMSTGEEILMNRAKALFERGFREARISADDAVSDDGNYFIINYDRKDKYESGHLPGAVRYKPNGTLGILSEMSTIPSDRPVAVYCGTGHSSAFVTAYLDLFGYDAYSIVFGNNKFMHGRMTEQESTLSWQPFSDAMIGDYPYVK